MISCVIRKVLHAYAARKIRVLLLDVMLMMMPMVSVVSVVPSTLVSVVKV